MHSISIYLAEISYTGWEHYRLWGVQGGHPRFPHHAKRRSLSDSKCWNGFLSDMHGCVIEIIELVYQMVFIKLKWLRWVNSCTKSLGGYEIGSWRRTFELHLNYLYFTMSIFTWLELSLLARTIFIWLELSLLD